MAQPSGRSWPIVRVRQRLLIGTPLLETWIRLTDRFGDGRLIRVGQECALSSDRFWAVQIYRPLCSDKAGERTAAAWPVPP